MALRGYKGKTHTTPDTSHLVWKVANNVKELKLLSFQLHRERYPNSDAKSVTNLLDEGENKFRSSSLKTFNKKIQALNQGFAAEDEIDELGAAEFASLLEEDESSVFIDPNDSFHV